MSDIKKPKKSIKTKKEPLLQLQKIYKQYGDKIVLKNIDLTINEGDRIGIIGANGSGKSTMSEIIGGIRQPSDGEVIRREGLKIGLQFQESSYPNGISVIDMIKYYLHSYQIEMHESELQDLLMTYQLLGFENKFINNLSGGQQQRLNILLSVIHNPDLVIFDEISTGLDIEVRSQIFDFLQENIVDAGKAMILVTHMMTEVEQFCNKFIYVHNGEIQEFGEVKDLIKDYGTVHNYTWQMFDKFKKADQEKQKVQYALKKDQAQAKAEVKKKPVVDKLISQDKDYGKNIPLISLILKYYFKGFFVPFFIIVYPILILFLQGFAFRDVPNQTGHSLVHSLIGSIAVVESMSIGIFVIPQTILEFKNSVLMKRIGATNIKKVFFIIAVIIIGCMFMIFAFCWTLLWGGIMFGSSIGWKDAVMPGSPLSMIPFLILLIISQIGIGMALASLFKSTTSFIAVANVIYLPIAFLSGGIVPVDLINNSDVLKYITYINPFKYCLDPFLASWNGQFTFIDSYYIFIPISIALIIGYISFSSWKLRWQS